jgi:hypothetical protein
MPGESNAGGEGAELDPKDPRIQEMINEAVKAATGGLSTKNNEILAEKKALAEKLTEMEKQWSGFDQKQVTALLDKMANDEDTKLIAEGKIDEVISKRVEALKSDYEKKLEAATSKISELETGLGEKDTKVKTLIVDSNVRQAASKLGIVPTAIEDVIYRAKQTFTLDDKDNLVARDGNGALIIGKSGKDPLTVAEWLDNMKEKAPHWYPGSSGIGAGGGQGGKGSAYSITKTEAQNPRTYQAAKEAAQKAGTTLQIVEG